MSDTFHGAMPEAICVDCGLQGCMHATNGPFVPSDSGALSTFCNRCWEFRARFYRNYEEPLPLKVHAAWLHPLSALETRLTRIDERMEILRRRHHKLHAIATFLYPCAACEGSGFEMVTVLNGKTAKEVRHIQTCCACKGSGTSLAIHAG